MDNDRPGSGTEITFNVVGILIGVANAQMWILENWTLPLQNGVEIILIQFACANCRAFSLKVVMEVFLG